MKKFAGDIIILHMCTKNHNYMMYGSWDTEWDRQSFLLFWAIFCPFTTPFPTSPLMILKIKTLKKNEKSTWRYYQDRFLPLYLPPPLPPFGPRKSKFWKNEKSAGRYYHFTHVSHIWCMVPGIWSMTDRIFCHFRPLPFYPRNNPKNQNFEKL